jgi:death-on-curing protein
MTEIIWLLEETVRAIHQRQLAEHGGGSGIRDTGLLQAALARPQRLRAYSEQSDVAAPAASYAFSILRNRPFVDGNKRTAFVAARTFLLLNGADLPGGPAERCLRFLRLAEGALSEHELAQWIRSSGTQ